jgi:hypothetical protein
MNEIGERYHGVLELIEEFEHLAMAMEDEDSDAITYFERQKGYLLSTHDSDTRTEGNLA